MTKEILLIFVAPLLLIVLVAAIDGKNSNLKRDCEVSGGIVISDRGVYKGCVDKQEKK